MSWLFVCYEIRVQFHSFVCGCPVFNSTLIEDHLFSIESSWILCQILVDYISMNLSAGSSFYSIIYACVFLCQYHAILITRVLWHSFKLESVMPSGLFFVRIALDIQEFLWFYTMLWIFVVLTKSHYNFEKHCIIFLCCFEWHFNNTTFFQSMSMEYLFTYLCLLQYLSLLFYSFQCTCFSLLIKFIPWYFILFDTIVNGI